MGPNTHYVHVTLLLANRLNGYNCSCKPADVTALRIMDSVATLSINDNHHKHRYKLNVITLNAVMLSACILSVSMLSVLLVKIYGDSFYDECRYAECQLHVHKAFEKLAKIRKQQLSSFTNSEKKLIPILMRSTPGDSTIKPFYCFTVILLK